MLALIFAILSVAACASTGQNLPPIPPVTCTAGKDCDAKWSRAVAWVSQNSGFKIQVQTDSLIQTYGPGEPDTTNLAATVNKVAKTGDQYEIIAKIGCANLIGCTKEPRAALTDFVKFVGGI
jgi:hypothetical protein